MKKTLKTPIYFLIISLGLMAFQCDEEIYEVDYQYSFEETIELYPAKKSYAVGDTIWIEFDNSDGKLFDSKSKKEIAIDSISLGFFIGFETGAFAPTAPTGGYYDYVTDNVSDVTSYIWDQGKSLAFAFGCNPSYSQRFRLGIKLKHRGIYLLRLQNSEDAGTNEIAVINCSTKKTPLRPSLIDYKFNLADLNKDIYMNLPPGSVNKHVKEHTEAKVNRKEMFIIKVE